MCIYSCACECIYVCVCIRVHVCAHVCVHVRTRACVHVHLRKDFINLFSTNCNDVMAWNASYSQRPFTT